MIIWHVFVYVCGAGEEVLKAEQFLETIIKGAVFLNNCAFENKNEP
jgi:hypothetical protein